MFSTSAHRKVYIALLCLIVISMTTSVFVTNLLWVLLSINWIMEWNWREKFADFRHNYYLHAVIVLAAVHLIWMLATENIAYGFFDIQKKLPLFILPLIVFTSKPLSRNESSIIGFWYVLTIIVVSIIGLVRYLTIPDLPYRDIVPYISHIRFGLNICLALFLLAYSAMRIPKPRFIVTNVIVALWLLFFLLMLHAYTSFVILFITSIILLIAFGKRLSKHTRRCLSLIVLGITIGVGGLTWHYCHDYFHLKELSTQPLLASTLNGNPYTHHNDGLIENGNYVNNYICEPELRQEWSKRSNFSLDSVTSNGYTLYPALLRYLNALGVTKDSLGMTRLCENDIRAIEKGTANPVYLQHGVRKLYYVLFFEYESYRCYHSVCNFSMLQRIELWRNGWQIFLTHPIFGVGTGDVVDVCHQRLSDISSPLAGTEMHTHNQYLNFLLAFGLFGFFLIAFFFIRAIITNHSCRNILFTAFLCILLISFISEDTLETLAGITFAALGYSLLSPRKAPKNQFPRRIIKNV